MGGLGNDTYYFNANSGNDIILKDAGNSQDRLVFSGEMIFAPDLYRSGDDLMIQGNGQSLTIQGWYTGAQYQFNNFTVIDSQGTHTMILKVGTSNNDDDG